MIRMWENTSDTPKVIQGFNATVFAYGATSAGKTHTMLGVLACTWSKVVELDSPGINLYTKMKDWFLIL